MTTRHITFRPETDSDDDDYDGFMFGDDFKPERKPFIRIADRDEDLYDAVLKGDLLKMKQEMEKLQFHVDDLVKGMYSVLHWACLYGYYDIVEYLLVEKKADVNNQVDLMTPLMMACDCTKQDSVTVEKIVKLLLKHGAVINVSDKFGTTPFMMACKNGHVNVVRLMIKDVSFDAVDNLGCTPIFYAIEYNRGDIVKLLIEAGVNYTKPNKKGYTPIQVAQFHGFYDMLEYFPAEKELYAVPTQFLAYNSLRDYIPRIFLKSECPEYFQEINTILLSIGMENFLEYFAKNRTSLAEFLRMDDEDLEKVGIQLPLYRTKIRKGLLDFHLHHWCNKAIARVSKSCEENFHDVLLMTANHLQNLIILNSSLLFIKKHLKQNLLGPLDNDHLQLMQENLLSYKATIKELHKTVDYLASFSPAKNPLYIDYDEYMTERKSCRFNSYLKYSIAIAGVSSFICLTFKRFFRF